MKDVKDLQVVVIGGGSGSSTVLRGLKSHTPNLSSIVTMFDSGGSSGLLQADFGYPPLGDLRQCLLSLSEDAEANHLLRELMDFRFRQESSLNGHSLGNLLLAALTTLGEDLEIAIDEMARLLRIKGQVIPVSLERADLCAELDNGQVLRGESNIDLRRQRFPMIRKAYLSPSVKANPKAISAILNADVVVLGPGDLYTSVIPNLLAKGIREALSDTVATRVYVCNLMTKLGETDGFEALDFIEEMIRYLGASSLDWVLINNREVPKEIAKTYLEEGAQPVIFNLDQVRKHVPGVFATSLAGNQVPMQHDPKLVAKAVLSIARLGRLENIHNQESPLHSDASAGKTTTSATGQVASAD